MADSSWPVGDAQPPLKEAKYLWVKQALLERIDRDLAPGSPVPSERELSTIFSVSRMTARRALDELVREGRVFREVGRGSFVTTPTIHLPLQLTSFTIDMDTRGLRPGARTLSSEIIPAEDLAFTLELAPDDLVYRVIRLRTADNTPMAIERVHIPSKLVPGLQEVDLTDRSLYSILATDYGLVFDGGEETIRARAATAEEARLLGVPIGDALLYLARLSRHRGKVVEYVASSYRADRYELSARIQSPHGAH